MASVLDKHGSIQAENTSLIGLCNISEDDIDHRDEHAVLLWVTGILNNGDHIGSLLSHVNKITSRTL
jgi:hypothetical protein